MKRYEKTDVDIDVFVSNVETLINQGIAEITEDGKIFKIHSTFFRLCPLIRRSGANICYIGNAVGSFSTYDWISHLSVTLKR